MGGMCYQAASVRLGCSPIRRFGKRDMQRLQSLTETQNAAASRLRVAVLIPCFNEEAAIARVVNDFRTALPQAAIHVYDNNSTDRTAAVAAAAGALVRRETHQG